MIREFLVWRYPHEFTLRVLNPVCTSFRLVSALSHALIRLSQSHLLIVPYNITFWYVCRIRIQCDVLAIQ